MFIRLYYRVFELLINYIKNAESYSNTIYKECSFSNNSGVRVFSATKLRTMFHRINTLLKNRWKGSEIQINHFTVFTSSNKPTKRRGDKTNHLCLSFQSFWLWKTKKGSSSSSIRELASLSSRAATKAVYRARALSSEECDSLCADAKRTKWIAYTIQHGGHSDTCFIIQTSPTLLFV